MLHIFTVLFFFFKFNVFFTFILVTTWAYALEPVKYGQDHQEDAYKPETGKPDYYT